MPRVVTPKEMARVEKLAYDKGYKESDFMGKAGLGVMEETVRFIEDLGLSNRILFLAGKGNNAGDGYTAALHLLQKGFFVVAVQPVPLHECSPLCQKMGAEFQKAGGAILGEIPSLEVLREKFSLIVDGIFGTGFHGAVEEPFRSMIETANRSALPILSIDIPSGLNGNTGEVGGIAIRAMETLYLELPKIGFFIGEGYNYVGIVTQVSFGLPSNYIQEAQNYGKLLTHRDVAPLLPKVIRTRHKYQAGTVVGLAGAPGMSGAALLSSLSALRGGAGMVYLLHPAGMEHELAASPYELLKVPYRDVQTAIEKLQTAKGGYIGPGLGRSPAIASFLRELLEQVTIPLVIDADALTLIGEHSLKPPPGTILTPHMGEMAKLLGETPPQTLSEPFLKKCQNYAKEKEITLVLKGAPSWIFHRGEEPSISPTGSPGMATAGSGDVLTGLLASLLAQGLDPKSAALLGTYLHGLAGEHASTEKTAYSMIASDIIHSFPEAYWELMGY